MIVSDVTDARILVELTRRLSFAAAARALAMPPATVSRRLADMERRAGLRLFERTTRSVVATEAGLLAAAHATRMVAEGDAIAQSIEAMRQAPTGGVRISTPVIFGQALLEPVASAFLAAYPNCALHVDLTDRVVNLVDDSVDVAIRVGPCVDEALVSRRLGDVRAGLYRAVGDGAAPATPKDLRDAPIGLLHVETAAAFLSLTAVDGAHVRIAVSPRLVCMNPWLLRDAALASDLIVVLPTIVGEPYVAKGRLTRVLPGWTARRAPIHINFISPHRMRPAVRAFIDMAVARLPAMLADDYVQ